MSTRRPGQGSRRRSQQPAVEAADVEAFPPGIPGERVAERLANRPGLVSEFPPGPIGREEPGVPVQPGVGERRVRLLAPESAARFVEEGPEPERRAWDRRQPAG